MKDTKEDVAPAEILLAEDEAAIREGLAALLESEGYAVRAVADGVAALQAFRARRPDLLVLDAMMPRKSGYAVCAEIRADDTRVPILFLTAKDAAADELRGFSLGADDYVAKTASEPVLLARIARALARARMSGAAPADTFDFGCWRVDALCCRLIGRDGATAELSLRELEMLRCFSRNSGEILSRDFLLTRFWGVDFEGEENTLSVAVARLREKLGPSGRLIETVWGKGYRVVRTG